MKLFAAILVFFVASGQAQDSTASVKPSVEVYVSTLKGTYRVGEPVRFRALLVNSGPMVYVSKDFGEAGGGIAGFYVVVTQLSGRRSGNGCVAVGDRYIPVVPHSSTQILKEDFLPLKSGGIVGFEGNYYGCEVMSNPGEYEIRAEYSAQDWYMGQLLSDSDASSHLLRGQFHSRPFRFRVVAAKSRKSQ